MWEMGNNYKRCQVAVIGRRRGGGGRWAMAVGGGGRSVTLKATLPQKGGPTAWRERRDVWD